MKFKFLNAILASLILCVSTSANAGLITITSYDIENATTSGWGGWNHTYNGNINITGTNLADYTNGSGTLNDGIIGSYVNDNQLFNTADNAEITLYLDGYYSIDSIKLFGGSNPNALPGGIETIDVFFGGITSTLAHVAFGVDDFFSTTGSNLNGITTNMIKIFNVPSGNCCGAYNITEIEVIGDLKNAPEQVPEPYTLAIFALGIIGLASRRFKKQS